MYKLQIDLETQNDILDFVARAKTVSKDVYLVDDNKHCVNAKSLLGCLYSIEFENTYVVSDDDQVETIFDDFRKIK